MIRKPAKGTPEYRLWLAALRVAAEAPVERGPDDGEVPVSWHLLVELREALTGLNLDWRALMDTLGAVRDEWLDG